MATAGAVIGGTADTSVTVTASSFSAGLVSRTTDVPTVTTRTITTAMAIIHMGTPLPMGTIMITPGSQPTDMTIAIVIAKGRQSLRSSAKWLERATIMVPLTESLGQKRVARSAPTNVRTAH